MEFIEFFKLGSETRECPRGLQLYLFWETSIKSPLLVFIGSELIIIRVGIWCCVKLKLIRFKTWAKEYGPVFSLKFGPSNIIVLCDREAIHELLNKKGNIYSDRPNTYVGQLLTKGDHIAIHQMDAMWREKRKVIAHNFSPKALDERHYRIQEAEFVISAFL